MDFVALLCRRGLSGDVAGGQGYWWNAKINRLSGAPVVSESKCADHLKNWSAQRSPVTSTHGQRKRRTGQAHRRMRNRDNVTFCTREFDQRLQEFGRLLRVPAFGLTVSRQQRVNESY